MAANSAIDHESCDAIKKFIDRWNKRGSEKSETQHFWNDLLQDVMGVKHTSDLIHYEKPIKIDDQPGYIDAFIPSTKVLIEQKSRGIDLDKAARQSDGSFLTPFEQAARYADELPYSQRPRWIVTSNFDEIRIYDMDEYHKLIQRDQTLEQFVPQIVKVARLVKDHQRLHFLIDPSDENIYPAVKVSKEGANIIKMFRKALIDYLKADNDAAVKSTINRFCVRAVFCLYAEDAAIFNRNQFIEYLRQANDRRRDALIDLFNVLNTPIEQRPHDLEPQLAAFPYVNGDLFSGSHDIPDFDGNLAHYLLSDAGDNLRFDWEGINPTVFGALFESAISLDTRRKGGMHYTSIANIHKVIDPLFMDDLHDEFRAIKRKRKPNRRRELEAFHLKLATLTFFDPACGSGNFLTETYLSIRQLENEVIRELKALGASPVIMVSIKNFYGIEINDFAVAIARTALWIAENQMLQETEMIVNEDINFLPLTSAAHIVEGNALQIDWATIVPRGVDYIIGNPPFSGARVMDKAMKADLFKIFDGVKGLGNLDYVTCWFKKAADFMYNTEVRAAFVATNSICQGENGAILWQHLFDNGIHIDFAHQTFRWTSESDDMAAVHCVVVGFSHAPNDKPKYIYNDDQKVAAKNINSYLIDAPNIIVTSRNKPLCDVPIMHNGNQPIDGGNLIIKAEDYEGFIRQEPRALKFIRRLIGGEEFINNKRRYVLWLVDATADEIESMPLVAERVENVRKFRSQSKAAATRKIAATPTLFAQITQPAGKDYIVVPEVSSERRRYVPIDYMNDNVICSNLLKIIPDASIYHFGVLTSSVHMSWMRVVCGRLESRYRYSKDVVYNNFPWPSPSDDQRLEIERTAQLILDVRARYDRSLASLYNELTMPDDLRAAHAANDRAVMAAYGFDVSLTESAIVSALMEMYRQLST